MSCSLEESLLNIVQGEDRTIPLKIVDSDGEPFSLVGATEIEAKFKKEDRCV